MAGVYLGNGLNVWTFPSGVKRRKFSFYGSGALESLLGCISYSRGSSFTKEKSHGVFYSNTLPSDAFLLPRHTR